MFALRVVYRYNAGMKFKFTSYMRKPSALSEITRDLGLLFFGSMIIGPIVTNQPDQSLIIYGTMFSLISWVGSIILSKD